MYHYAANNPVRYVDPDGRDISAVAQNQSFWTGVGIILGTVAEDIVTFGVGIADDPVTLAIGVGLILAACRVASNGNNQASPSPLFGSNANVATASPNPLPPDGDDQDNNKTSRSGFDKNQSAKDAKIISSNDEANKFAKSKGYESAHDLKKFYAKEAKDKKIAHYDLYKNSKTGEAFMIHKRTGFAIPLD